ncbi:uncharacterized protein LOC133740668 isoform X1 [Rosa rugosa]|uniref:uncharacterized protein LOC133740668 isoform X1 n=1 Tax=Rosa rugosa TaxID=74645 RepID=UPI002B4127D8|nr:uncharacterized protein LOC133740668 isoform X1 [Rosa rugosa]
MDKEGERFQNQNPNPNQSRGSTRGRSCKGCLYYSSLHKSKSKYPTCVGFYRTLNQGLSLSLSQAQCLIHRLSATFMGLIYERWKLVTATTFIPSYIVGETELEASKADRSLTDFKYGCVGYSVFLDRKDSSDPHKKQAELPFCVGLEILYDKRPADQAHAPTPARKSGDNVRPLPQPRSYKPHSTGDEYLTRFKRNAGLVASGVARNLNRVGNHIKQSVDNILFGRSK